MIFLPVVLLAFLGVSSAQHVRGVTRPLPTIPQVDISPLLALDIDGVSIDAASRHVTEREVANQLAAALREIGFVTIIGHGVGHDMFNLIHNRSAEFFQMNDPAKLRLSPAKWNQQTTRHYRGYFPASVNGKQGFDVCFANPLTSPYYVRHMPLEENPVFPREAPSGTTPDPGSDVVRKGWIRDVRRYYLTMLNVAKRLLRLISIAWDLPKDYLETRLLHEEAPFLSTMRLNYYPPTTQAEASLMDLVDNEDDGAQVALSCESHCDNGLLTLLYQGDVGGLQVQVKRDGDNGDAQDDSAVEWIDVPVVPGSIIVNTGVAMQQLVNGMWNATNHRVVVTGKERISVPFFFEPSYNANMEPLEPCVVAQGGKNLYAAEPNTYGPYIQKQNQRLKEYRREGLESDKEKLQTDVMF